MRVAFRDLDELPDGPGIYIVWSAIGSMYGLAGLEARPLYIGKTKRSVAVRMAEHLRENDDAITLFEATAEIQYLPAQNDRHARAMERELQEELNPYYGIG